MKLKMTIYKLGDEWKEVLNKDCQQRNAKVSYYGENAIIESEGTMEKMFEVFAVGMHYGDYELRMWGGDSNVQEEEKEEA